MSDLISRQAAIDTIMGEPTDTHYPSWYAERLEQLPSAQSEPLTDKEQKSILDKIRAEIAEYGSIWVEYKITGRRDKDIEQLVSDVLSQAKKQVLEVIDKYKVESEGQAN